MGRRATLSGYRAAVRQDLSDDQWHAVEAGELTAPSGTTYTRRTTRMKRKDAASLVESGCPVVTYWPGGLPEMTRVIWHDGEDARAAWESARGEITSDTPRLASSRCHRHRRPLGVTGRRRLAGFHLAPLRAVQRGGEG